MIRNNRGFSLIELMVAMVVGLVIILGAGQLFLTVFTNNQRVDTLGEKQAAVNFATETLLRDIRRADWDESDWNESDDDALTLVVNNHDDVSSGCSPGDEVIKKYKLKERKVAGKSEWFMAVNISECDGNPLGGGYQELVGSFVSGLEEKPGFDIDDNEWSDGIVKVIFRLVPTDNDSTLDPLKFYAVNRGSAIDYRGECGLDFQGDLVQNAQQDFKPSLFVDGLLRGQCDFQGNKHYRCKGFDAPKGSAIRVELDTKNSGKSRVDKFEVGEECQLY